MSLMKMKFYFPVMKGKWCKADISRPEIQAQMNARGEARRQGVALGEYRQRNIACQRNIGSITAHKYAQWYRFMQTYLRRCLNGEQIEG